MAQTIDTARLRKLLKIYLVIQLFLAALLVYMAVHFQAGLNAEGKPQAFLSGAGMALVVQMLVFYPIKKFAGIEAKREIETSATDLTGEQMKALRNRRMIGDLVRTAVFVFYAVFLLAMPAKKAVVWPVFLSFVLTFLTYFQCVSYSLKRGIAPKG